MPKLTIDLDQTAGCMRVNEYPNATRAQALTAIKPPATASPEEKAIYLLARKVEDLRAFYSSMRIAKRCLEDAKNRPEGLLKTALQGMAVIRYALPFKRNYGDRIQLDADQVFAGDAVTLATHKSILTLRDQRGAHLDEVMAVERAGYIHFESVGGVASAGVGAMSGILGAAFAC